MSHKQEYRHLDRGKTFIKLNTTALSRMVSPFIVTINNNNDT